MRDLESIQEQGCCSLYRLPRATTILPERVYKETGSYEAALIIRVEFHLEETMSY